MYILQYLNIKHVWIDKAISSTLNELQAEKYDNQFSINTL